MTDDIKNPIPAFFEDFKTTRFLPGDELPDGRKADAAMICWSGSFNGREYGNCILGRPVDAKIRSLAQDQFNQLLKEQGIRTTP